MIHSFSRSRRRSAGSARGGFTLLEVMMAFSVLAFGILTMTMMQLAALRQGGASRHTTDAAAVGRSYLEQVHRLPWAALDNIKDGGWVAPGWAGARSSVDTAITNPDGNTTIEHSYDVQWQVKTVGGSTCLLDVEMQVTWPEQGHTNNKRFVLATRRYNWGGPSC